MRVSRWNPRNIKDDRIVMIIGRRGSGKSVIQRDIMRHMSDRVDFGIAMTPTEETAEVYANHMPESCIYRQFDQPTLERMIQVQKSHLRDKRTPKHMFLLMDDCLYQKSVLKSEAMRNVFLNGRHLHLHLSCACQYLMDLSPDQRSNIDYVICTRDSIIANRTKLWKYFFGMFSTYDEFSRVFDKCTENFSAIVLDNTTSSGRPEDCVFWYRAELDPGDFRMGKDIYWKMSQARSKTTEERRKEQVNRTKVREIVRVGDE